MAIILTLTSETDGGSWRGVYDAGTAYAALDCVVDANGATFAALQPSTGQTPSSSPLFWEAATIALGPRELPRVRCS